MSMLTERTRNKGLFIFFLLLLWCCSPEAKYKTLKIFFDGVPDPQATEEQKEEQPAKKSSSALKQPATTMKSRHSDYEQKRCSRCHDTTSANYLAAERKKVCFLCHKEDDFRGAFVHGPVAVGDCLPCHHPHESEHPKLLKAAGESLCFKCHKPDHVMVSKVHLENKAEVCSSCHLPHAAENRFLTKIKTP